MQHTHFILGKISFNDINNNYKKSKIEHSRYIKESEGEMINICENDKNKQSDDILATFNHKYSNFDNLFNIFEIKGEFYLVIRIVCLPSTEHMTIYMFLVVKIINKNKIDNLNLADLVSFNDNYFKSFFHQSKKFYLKETTIISDAYSCIIDINICTKYLINKYSILYYGNITEMVSKNLFNDGKFQIKEYSIILSLDNFDIELNILNQKNNYPVAADFFSYDESPCSHIICKNNGKCQFDNKNKIIKCICENGITGLSCEHKYSCGYCNSNYCIQNTKCQNCSKDLKGDNCESQACNNINMCSNNGMCNDDNGLRKCLCTKGWKGLYCHIQNCISKKKCLNGGECINHKGKDLCACLKDFRGEFCQIKISL